MNRLLKISAQRVKFLDLDVSLKVAVPLALFIAAGWGYIGLSLACKL